MISSVATQPQRQTELQVRLDINKKTPHNSEFAFGGIPEWLKGADCKSVGLAPTLVRIQLPPPAARNLEMYTQVFHAGGYKGFRLGCMGEGIFRGCSSMVEQQPSKLMTRVRFPSPAPVNIFEFRPLWRKATKQLPMWLSGRALPW